MIIFAPGIIAILTLAIPVLFSNYLAATILIPIALLFILFPHDSKIWKIWVFGALFGPLSEAFCIYYGLWNYAHPDFFGIPIWLPLVWGNVFILGALLYKMIPKRISIK